MIKCVHSVINMKPNYQTYAEVSYSFSHYTPKSYTFTCLDCGKERMVESFIKDSTLYWAQKILENINEHDS